MPAQAAGVRPNRGKFVGAAKPGPTDYPPALVTIGDGDFRTPRRQGLGPAPSDLHLAARSARLSRLAQQEVGRAGNPKPIHYGGGLKDLCKYGNFTDSKSVYNARIVAKCAENPSPEGTAPAGSYQPNGWGLHDMIGNAFELTEDCASENYHGRPCRRLAVARGRRPMRKLRYAELFVRQHGDGFALGRAVLRGRHGRPQQRSCYQGRGVALGHGLGSKEIARRQPILPVRQKPEPLESFATSGADHNLPN
jgi:Sulfatase-modifying factor enzyme 1